MSARGISATAWGRVTALGAAVLLHASAPHLALAASSSSSSSLAPPQMAPPRLAPPQPERLTTKAPNAIIVDLGDAETPASGVLFRKEASHAIPPASMTKLMTLFMTFEALELGTLALDHEVAVSRHAAEAPGSTMFLARGERVSIENLIRGAAVQSGNDAAITLAEAIAGDERSFAHAMTRRARELGMESARFENATGLPHPHHKISVTDLARLAVIMFRMFPNRIAYFEEQSFRWAGVSQHNRNPLLGRGLGVDGLKTGHTNAAGYCIVLSAARDGRRVVIVLAGLKSKAARERAAAEALEWAYGRIAEIESGG